jgi:hypothetical protein
MRKLTFALFGSLVVWFTTPLVQGFLEGFGQARRVQQRESRTATAIATYHHLNA